MTPAKFIASLRGNTDPNWSDVQHLLDLVRSGEWPDDRDGCEKLLVTVKPLIWERGIVHWARPLPGMKYVACSSDPYPCWSWWLDSVEGPISHNRCESEASAKAAAQADYQARIRSTLLMTSPFVPTSHASDAALSGIQSVEGE